MAWIIDWPEAPELGHYLAEEPSPAGRSRGLYAEPVAAQPAAPETPQTIQCNACNWIGSSADAHCLGGREPIGPLCPECHETTGPADDAAPPEAPHVADYEAVIADHARLVRELDVALNGDNAARQASLCDLVAQVKSMKPVAQAPTPEAPQPAAPLGTPQNPICIDSEEMARLAEFAGVSVDNREDAAGILLWVGEHRDDDGAVGYGLCASLEDYPEEGCYPLVELPRQQPADGAATLRSAIRAMASMLQAREWAEHVSISTDPDVTDLEAQITELVGTATKLREQNAALGEAISLQHANGEALAERVMQAEEQNATLVAAIKAIEDQTSRAGFEFGGPLAVATKEGLGDRDELLELAGIAGGYLESISLTAEQALASAKGGAV